MGRVAEKILDVLAAEVTSRTEWDEPPALFLLYLEGGECHLRQLEVPARLWSGNQPTLVLEALAGSLGDLTGLLRAIAPEGLYGAAFMCEMFEVRAAEGDAAALAGAKAAAEQRRLFAHPGRMEVRSMWAADRGGASYDATLERESGQVRRVVTYPKPGVTGFTGLIPESLDKIVTTLLGVPMPARTGVR